VCAPGETQNRSAHATAWAFSFLQLTMQRTLIATVAAAAFLTLAGTAQAQTSDLNTHVDVGSRA